MKKLFLAVLILFTLTGCFNYHELENFGITSSILFDYEGDEYKITIEIVEKEEEEDKQVLYEGSGKTISDALQKALLSAGKKLSYYHLNAVLLTENVDIHEVLLYLIRNPQINNSFYVVLTESKEVYDNEEDDLGKTISEILKATKSYSFFDIAEVLFDDKLDMALPYLSKDLRIDSVVPYHQFKQLEKLNFEETEIYKMLANVNGSNVDTKCSKDKNFTVNVNSVSTSFKFEDKIKTKVKLEVSIAEFTCDFDLREPKGIDKVESLANKQIKKEIEEVLKKIKDGKADLFGLNQIIYNKRHTLDKSFYDYDFEVEVETHINKKGLIY